MSMPAAAELAWRAREANLALEALPPTFIEPANRELALMGYDQLVAGDVVTRRLIVSPRQDESPKPLSSLIPEQPYVTEATYPGVEDARITMVGAGAGGIACAAYLTQRGFEPTNITMVDPRGNRGSLWETGLREGGFNNFKPLRFPPDHVLPLTNRNGDNMRDFWRRITDKHLTEVAYVQDRATNAYWSRESKAWVIETAQGKQVEADYVVIGTGRPIPRKIAGKYIDSNLDTIAQHVSSNLLVVEREQRTMFQSEMADGRMNVCIGFGNSTLTMLKQWQAYQDKTGHDVPYVVLTHLPREAIENPRRAWKELPPVFRNPKEGRIVGISGDLQEDAAVYLRALREERILTGVTDVHFSTWTNSLKIRSTDRRTKSIEAPRVFALVGYERDNQLFTAIGARVMRGLLHNNPDGPYIRGSDGAVLIGNQDYYSNVFAIGSAAATPEHPTAGVIPGIFATLPRLTLTVATREQSKHHRPAPQLHWLLRTILPTSE